MPPDYYVTTQDSALSFVDSGQERRGQARSVAADNVAEWELQGSADSH